MNANELKIGEKLDIGLPKDKIATNFNYLGNNFAQLIISIPEPTKLEIESIDSNCLILGLLYEAPVLLGGFRAFSSDNLPLLDLDFPYNVNLSPTDDLEPSCLKDTFILVAFKNKIGMDEFNRHANKKMLLLQIVLVDAINSIIKVIRVGGLAESITNAFFTYARHQKTLPFDNIIYNKNIDQLYSKYPDPTFIFNACNSYCVLGDYKTIKSEFLPPSTRIYFY